jgi:putative ABC transport system permease protein
MSLLDRKLLRDLRALRSQALAVALVMACGLAMMITTRSLILSLETARDTYYGQNHFAEVFARLKRAPNALREQLATIPGVAAVETSIAIQVTLDVPGLAEPAVGLINSLPEHGEPILNRVYLRTGRLPLGGTTRGELAADTDLRLTAEVLWDTYVANYRRALFDSWTPDQLAERSKRQIELVLKGLRT